MTNFETATSTSGTTFTDLRKATSITESSRIYMLKETPKEILKLLLVMVQFLGISSCGNKVTVDYLSCKGEEERNGGKSLLQYLK